MEVDLGMGIADDDDICRCDAVLEKNAEEVRGQAGLFESLN